MLHGIVAYLPLRFAHTNEASRIVNRRSRSGPKGNSRDARHGATWEDGSGSRPFVAGVAPWRESVLSS